MQEIFENPVMTLIVFPIITGFIVIYLNDYIRWRFGKKSNEDFVVSEIEQQANISKSGDGTTGSGEIKLTIENFDRLRNFIAEGKLSEELNLTAEEVVFFEDKQKNVLKNLNVTFKKNAPPPRFYYLLLDNKKALKEAIKFEFDDETNDLLKIFSISNIKQYHPFILRLVVGENSVNLNIIPKYGKKYSIHDLKEWYSFIVKLSSSNELKLQEKSNIKSIIPIDLKIGTFSDSDIKQGCETNLQVLNYVTFLQTKGYLKKSNSFPVFLKYKDLSKISELNELITKGYIEKYHLTLTAGLFRKQIFFLLKQGKILKSMMFVNDNFFAKEQIGDIEDIQVKGLKLMLLRFKIKNRFILFLKCVFYFYRSNFQVEFVPFDKESHAKIQYMEIK